MSAGCPPFQLFLIFVLPVLLGAVSVAIPVALPAGYHDFADHSAVAGLHPFGDIVSNLAFLAAGFYVWAQARSTLERFVAIALIATSFGSTFYHLAPGDGRLLVDRLPMAPAFAGMGAIALFAEGDRRALPFTLVMSILFAAAAVWALASGNQAPFVAAQVYVLLLVLTATARPELRWSALAAFALYVAAKLTETFDHQLLHATGLISGHTIKHIMAGLAPILWFALWRREAAGTLSNLRHLS